MTDTQTTSGYILNRTHPGRFLVALFAVLLALPTAGCKSTSREPTDLPDAMAQVAQRRSEAIKLGNSGYQLHMAGKLEKAELQYRLSLDLDSTAPQTWNNLGELLLSQGFYLDAVQAFSEASALAPNDPRPEYNIAVAYQKAGWSTDALKYFDNALARDAHYRPALRGAIKSAAEIGIANREVYDWIRTGLLTETDPVWRDFFSVQRFRVEAALEDQRYRD